MGHAVDLPNTDWVAENHWCVPLYYRPGAEAATRRRGAGGVKAGRVLVTGGAGFIGSHVVDRLAAAGHEPVIFDVLPPAEAPAGTETVLGSIEDLGALTDAMTAATRSSTWRRSPTSATSTASRSAPRRSTAAARCRWSRPSARRRQTPRLRQHDLGLQRLPRDGGRRGDADPGAEPPLHGDQARRRALLPLTPSSTTSSGRSCASASPTGRGPARPRCCRCSSARRCAASR